MKDIKTLERIIEQYKECKRNCEEFTVNSTALYREEYEAIENLINKTKEQEKIIELMAKDIAHDGFDEDICRAFIQEKRTWECNDDRNCTRCIIEYYKKKAKGE